MVGAWASTAARASAARASGALLALVSAGLLWSAPAGATAQSAFFVQASDQRARPYVFVNVYYPGQPYGANHPPDNLQLTVGDGGMAYPSSHQGRVQAFPPALIAGDPIGVTDTTTNQTFGLVWQSRPSATLGVCAGSSHVAGLLSAPQGSPVLTPPTLSFVTAQHQGGGTQGATTTSFPNSYSATFASPLGLGDLVDTSDQWEGMVGPNDVTMQSVHESVVTDPCSTTGQGVTPLGGIPGFSTPGFALEPLDLAHGIRDLLGRGLIVTLDLACPVGDTCGIAVNAVSIHHDGAQAAIDIKVPTHHRKQRGRHHGAKHRRGHKQHPVQAFYTLARGYLTAGSSGPASVTVKATRTGRRRLRGKNSATFVLLVTARDKQAGTSMTVKPTVTMHR